MKKNIFFLVVVMMMNVVRGQWSSDLPDRNYFILEDNVYLDTGSYNGARNNSKSFDIAYSMFFMINNFIYKLNLKLKFYFNY